MSETVNILMKGYSSQLTENLSQKIAQAVIQSSCKVIEQLPSANEISIKIRAFSDKLEKLHHNLQQTGITLSEGSGEMLKNASQQYSVFRDIEVTLTLNLSKTNE